MAVVEPGASTEGVQGISPVCERSRWLKGGEEASGVTTKLCLEEFDTSGAMPVWQRDEVARILNVLSTDYLARAVVNS